MLPDHRLALVLIGAFFAVNLIGLDHYPLVNGDEPWIAEPGYRFWAQGGFVSELHRGFYGVERHFLLHSPLFSILVGGVIYVFGPGLLQVRLVSLAMAAATAALTFALGRRLLSPRHGLLAVLLLISWRVGSGLPSYPTGIPLVDLGRLARYDIAVPVAGLTAFLLVLPVLNVMSPPEPSSSAAAGDTRHALPVTRLVLAGICLGLAVASHPTGLAWAAILCVSLVVARRPIVGATACLWMLAGMLTTLLPYLWFMYRGWDDLVNQQRYVGIRYHLLDPRFYLENVLREWRRYSQIGRGLLAAQPASWLISLGGLVGLWTLWRGAGRHDPRARVLRHALLVGAGLFALFVQPKPYHYVAALWPLLALTAAVGLVTLLRAPARFVRSATLALLIVTIADGAVAWIRLMQRSVATTSYRSLCDRLAAQIPKDSYLLALPHYWLGLASHVRGYRSLFGPMLFASPAFAAQHPPLGQLLADTEATVVLLDPPMLTFLRSAFDPTNRSHTFVNSARGLRDYLAREGERIVVVDDPSYGRFEIHYLRRRAASP